MDQKKLPVLLLSPWLLNTNQPAIELLDITKKDQLISYTNTALEWPVVRKTFRDVPKPARDLMMAASLEALEEFRQQLKKLQSLEPGNVIQEELLEKNMVQYWYKILDGFKPYLPLVKWYHRKAQPGKKNYLIGPCSFTKYRPSLSFDVVRIDGLLDLQINVSINNVKYAIGEFMRSHFLLESRNEYFILTLQDYRTVQKLSKTDFSPYAHSPELFAQHVLSELEGQYPVNRNNLFPVKQVSIIPINRLLLTELNNAFLMLTPQWVYDSNTIDGEWKESFEVIKEGAVHLIKRNREAELAFVKTLESLHINFSKQRNGYFYLSFADAQKKQWFLKIYHQLLQMDIEVAGMDMLQHFRYSPHSPETTMQLIQEDQHLLLYKTYFHFV